MSLYVCADKSSVAANNSKFAIEERRRRLASLLARSKTEQECAQELGVSQPTISNDIKALKEMSLQFVFDLAKSDLAHFYRQELKSIEEAKRICWNVCDNPDSTTKEKLLAAKIIISASEATSKLLAEGPAILSLQALEQRVSQVETV